ncbi:ABC transporter permease [Marinobacter koreensis]|uniref:ABC transporter permease n=1 Tax=Marinobacter koreensis TaxID=335974 RepID=UPI003621D7BA
MRSRRLFALIKKESLQMIRDPSAILIAFVLPVVLLFLFAYAVSLDIRQLHLGVVLQTDSAKAQSLAAEFSGTSYFQVLPARHRDEVTPLLVSGELKGYVLIPPDFDHRLARGESLIQVVTDGTQPNTANFVAGYARGYWWTGWRIGAFDPRSSWTHGSGSTQRWKPASSWCPVPLPLS